MALSSLRACFLVTIIQDLIYSTVGYNSGDFSNPSIISTGQKSLSNDWSGSTEVVPSPRTHASLCAAGSNLFLFGGEADRKQADGSFYLNDLYMFDKTRGVWSDDLSESVCCKDNEKVDAYGVRPSPRAQHSATLHPGSMRMFIFGGISDRNGFNGEPLSQHRYSGYGSEDGVDVDRSVSDAISGAPQYLNDIHYFDVDITKDTLMRWSGKLTTIGSGPTPRAAHAMVEHGGFLYIFGGRSGSRIMNDMHKFDVISFSWTPVRGSGAPPSPRHFFASCATSSHFYVYGGLWEKYPDESIPLATSEPSFQVPVSEPSLGGVETRLKTNQSETEANIIVPLDGLYSFNFANNEWLKLSDRNQIQLGRMSSPSSGAPRPRYGAHLVPVGSGESSLMLLGGLDGDVGISADEVALYDITHARWELNDMTGLSDLDSASTVTGSVGSGVSQWQERDSSQHQFSSRRSNDGQVKEYDQYDAHGRAVRPYQAFSSFEGVPPRKMSQMSASGVIRASPSVLASRPQPRIGLAWTVSDGKLFEFGGQRLLRTLKGEIRYADKVNELNIFTASSLPEMRSRPHGTGANIADSIHTQKSNERGQVKEATSYGSGLFRHDATRGQDRGRAEDLVVSKRTLYVFESSVIPSSTHSNAF